MSIFTRRHFLASKSGGKTFLNPVLMARRSDERRVRLINRIDQPTVIQQRVQGRATRWKTTTDQGLIDTVHV